MITTIEDLYKIVEVNCICYTNVHNDIYYVGCRNQQNFWFDIHITKELFDYLLLCFPRKSKGDFTSNDLATIILKNRNSKLNKIHSENECQKTL